MKQLQEEKFNVRGNAPLPLNDPTGTKKPQNPRKRNTLHDDNLSSIKKYFNVVHTTKNNTPPYSYKKKIYIDYNVTGDLPDEASK